MLLGVDTGPAVSRNRRPSAFPGGNIVLDTMAAHSALERLAGQTGLSSQQAAQGVIDLASGPGYSGPLLVVDDVASSWVAPGWTVVRHESGCLLLER